LPARHARVHAAIQLTDRSDLARRQLPSIDANDGESARAGARPGDKLRITTMTITMSPSHHRLLDADEKPFVIAHREALLYMLCAAAELEHGLMCE